MIRSAASPMPELSVVIAAYNAADFIEETISSILLQADLEFEVVVVDDASTDRTPDILAAMTDARLSILRLPERLPVSGVRNRAMPHVRAPWLCVFDSDDVMLPGRLAPYAKKVMSQPGVAWGYCGLAVTDEKLNQLKMQMRNHFDLVRQLGTNLIPHPMSMIRRDLFLKVGGYDESLRVNVDYDLWLRLLEHTEPYFYDEIGLFYRRHAGALGNTNPGQAPVFERLAARLSQTSPDPDIEKRRDVLRGCLAFLKASDAGDHVTTIQTGDKLRRAGVVSFDLDRRQVVALEKLGCASIALGITLEWVQKSLNRAQMAQHAVVWSLQESLRLATALGRKDVVETLLPLAKTVPVVQLPADKPQK